MYNSLWTTYMPPDGFVPTMHTSHDGFVSTMHTSHDGLVYNGLHHPRLGWLVGLGLGLQPGHPLALDSLVELDLVHI